MCIHPYFSHCFSCWLCSKTLYTMVRYMFYLISRCTKLQEDNDLWVISELFTNAKVLIENLRDLFVRIISQSFTPPFPFRKCLCIHYFVFCAYTIHSRCPGCYLLVRRLTACVMPPLTAHYFLVSERRSGSSSSIKSQNELLKAKTIISGWVWMNKE